MSFSDTSSNIMKSLVVGASSVLKNRIALPGEQLLHPGERALSRESSRSPGRERALLGESSLSRMSSRSPGKATALPGEQPRPVTVYR